LVDADEQARATNFTALGGHHGRVGVKIWKMISYDHKRDEEELVKFGECAIAAARAPP
jgi:hypothetical protein